MFVYEKLSQSLPMRYEWNTPPTKCALRMNQEEVGGLWKTLNLGGHDDQTNRNHTDQMSEILSL